MLSAIKQRGLIDRTFFGSDGPQYFGKLPGYLKLMLDSMNERGYRHADMRAILSEKFYRCFHPRQ